MARFGDPSHNQHKLAGMRKALASPSTPAHLKPHIQKALGEPMAYDDMDDIQANAGAIGRSVDPNVGFMGKGPMAQKPQSIKPKKPSKAKKVKSGIKGGIKNALMGY